MKHIETVCVQGEYKPSTGEARVLPIYQSTTYAYNTCEDMGKAFNLEIGTHLYTRISNPTLSAVAAKINALEGGVGAMLTSSGQTANMIAVLNICHSGQNILASSEIYGGTVNLFSKTLAEMGIETRYFSLSSTDGEIEKLIDGNTRLIFGETLSNPSLAVFDIERFAALAHRNGLPLIIDNTFPTPINCRPFEFGADIVTHSTTKYMDGHACVVGGAIVDGGSFDWAASGKYPAIANPNPSYHGVSFVKAVGPAAFVTYIRAILLRDTGATISPFAAFLLLQGIETLSLRLERHAENTRKVVDFLAHHPQVERVNHPSLPEHPDHALYEKYFPNGGASIFTFDIKGGKDAAFKFIDKLQIFSLLANVADVKSLVIHPATTTHSQLTAEELEDQGIHQGTIRLSIGTENINDILADLEQAFN